MKNLGEQLRLGRENRGLSIDDVSREINIAQKYIIALENEDFTLFPAEAYMLGFMKNYGEYLGLNVKELLSLYRVLKIQEYQVPPGLTDNPPLNIPRILTTSLIAAAAIALVAAPVYYFFFMPKTEQSEEPKREPVEYSLSEGVLEKRFFEGDTLMIPLNDSVYKITLSAIGDIITLSAPGKDVKIDMNNEAEADINNDGFAELHVSVEDYAQNRPEVGALLRFGITNAQQTVAAEEQGIPAMSAGSASRVIFSSANPYPFMLRVVFSGYCMFRWEILREAAQQGRTERYFIKGEEQTIRAQNGVRIWVSNSSAVKMWVIGGGNNVPLEAGAVGEVIVEEIYWSREEDGRYKLIQARLET
jgi:cytoskeletal protein RodZ